MYAAVKGKVKNAGFSVVVRFDLVEALPSPNGGVKPLLRQTAPAPAFQNRPILNAQATPR